MIIEPYYYDKVSGRKVCSAGGGAGSNPMNPLETWPAIEITIEAQNRPDTVTLHHRDVDGIAG